MPTTKKAKKVKKVGPKKEIAVKKEEKVIKKKEKAVKKDQEPVEAQYAQMQKAYAASAQILKAKMQKDRAAEFELLDKTADDNIIIVKGVYDKIELVLNAIGIDYVILEGPVLGRIDLRCDQILIINCPGSTIDEEGLNDIKQFVDGGGFLLTTDWCLTNILEKAFPGYVAFNNKSTRDDVVGIQIADKSHPFLKGLFSDVANPQWWLETSSYPIKIQNKEEVKVLVKSKDLKQKYGEDPVVITFSYGKGTVMHMISHYYLQRSDTRTDRHKESAVAYVKEMSLDEKEVEMEELKDVSLGEVESAYTSAQFISNIIVEKQKENLEKKEQSEEDKE